MALEEIIDLPPETLVECVIDRATRTQPKDGMGGTNYNFDSPTVVFQSVFMAIQSLEPDEINKWAQRGIEVSHICYTNEPMSNIVLQGDRVKDGRYSSPDVFYTVVFVEDMAGVGALWKVYTKLN